MKTPAPPNPFRSPLRRDQFERCVKMFRERHRNLFHAGPDGPRPHRGNAFAAHFWAGYRGIVGGLFNPADRGFREGGGYIFYRAGAACSRVDGRFLERENDNSESPSVCGA